MIAQQMRLPRLWDRRVDLMMIKSSRYQALEDTMLLVPRIHMMSREQKAVGICFC